MWHRQHVSDSVNISIVHVPHACTETTSMLVSDIRGFNDATIGWHAMFPESVLMYECVVGTVGMLLKAHLTVDDMTTVMFGEFKSAKFAKTRSVDEASVICPWNPDCMDTFFASIIDSKTALNAVASGDLGPLLDAVIPGRGVSHAMFSGTYTHDDPISRLGLEKWIRTNMVFMTGLYGMIDFDLFNRVRTHFSTVEMLKKMAFVT